MKRVEQYFPEQGYDGEYVSDKQPYDLLCKKGADKKYTPSRPQPLAPALFRICFDELNLRRRFIQPVCNCRGLLADASLRKPIVAWEDLNSRHAV